MRLNDWIIRVLHVCKNKKREEVMDLLNHIPYQLVALVPILIFVLVHLFANRVSEWGKLLHGRFLSIGGGVAIAYVFVDLLPKLGASEMIVKEALEGIFPYFERHVYVLSLIGFLLFFLIDRRKTLFGRSSTFWLSVSSYALFNFFVGYAVVDENDPEVQPLVLFTIAIALHYFTNDYALNKSHGRAYTPKVKWFLIACLFAGWLLGLWIELPPAAVALVGAFIGGGVIMNVMRHELPADNPNSLETFVIAAGAYSIILLTIGS
jgi:hypothetical protein